MSFRRSLAVARHEFRVLRRDLAFFVMFLAMPLLLMAFLTPSSKAIYQVRGGDASQGVAQAVPGISVFFSLFLMNNVAVIFFREHSWNTWERLRASWARPAEIMLGKAITPFVHSLVQLAVLFVAGGILFGLEINGSYPGLVLVAVAFSCFLVAAGFALVALCRTLTQVNLLNNVGSFLLAGLGGAVAPLEVLPGWARAVAPISPGYWAMRGFRAVIVGRGGVGDVVVPVGVLLAIAAGLLLIAAARFRVEDAKVGWA